MIPARLRILIVAATFLLCGCDLIRWEGVDGGTPPPPPAPCTDRREQTSLPPETGVAGIAGRAAAITLYAPLADSCSKIPPAQAASAVARVVDPAGNEVPATVSLRMVPFGHWGASLTADAADVTFMPAVDGPHEVSVIFGEGFGTATRTIWIARDDSATAERAELSFDCSSPLKLPSGALRCSPHIIRGIETIHTFGDYSRHDVSGEILWEFDASDRVVRRFRDDGSGPLVETHLSYSTAWPQLTVPGIFAAPDDAVVWFSSPPSGFHNLQLYATELGSVVDRSSFSSPLLADADLLIRDGALLRAIQIGNSDTSVCTFSIQEGQIGPAAAEPCVTLPGLFIGKGDGGLWTKWAADEQTVVLRFYSGADVALAEVGALELDHHFTLLDRGGWAKAPPVLEVGTATARLRFLLRREGPRLFLSYYEPLPGYGIDGTTRMAVFGYASGRSGTWVSWHGIPQ